MDVKIYCIPTNCFVIIPTFNYTEQDLMTKKIIESYKKLLKPQDYSKKPTIDGVKIFELKNFVSDDGFLCEVARLDEKGNLEGQEGFKFRQINFTKVMPGSIKAWHLHFNQTDLWYVPPDGYLSVGLVDLRANSSTKEVRMRSVLGAGKSQMILIPSGVAHGYANFTQDPLYVFYFVNQQFNSETPDEGRLPWDLFGKDFWEITPG